MCTIIDLLIIIRVSALLLPYEQVGHVVGLWTHPALSADHLVLGLKLRLQPSRVGLLRLQLLDTYSTHHPTSSLAPVMSHGIRALMACTVTVLLLSLG